MLWLEPNREVHCKLIYSVNVMYEGIFSKWRGSELAKNYTTFRIRERENNKSQVFGRGIQKV